MDLSFDLIDRCVAGICGLALVFAFVCFALDWVERDSGPQWSDDDGDGDEALGDDAEHWRHQ